jgi:hypothetical protein
MNSIRIAVSNSLQHLRKCLLPALIVQLLIWLVQQLEHQPLGLILIAQRYLFPEFHQAREVLDRILVHFFVVMHVDDGGQNSSTMLAQLPSQCVGRSPDQSRTEQSCWHVLTSGWESEPNRTPPPLSIEVVGLERNTPSSLARRVQGISKIDGSTEQAIIPAFPG